MRRTKRALAIMAFTLVSCSTSVVPASTPTSDAAVLRIYATTPVIPLLNELTFSYSTLFPKVTFETVSGNYDMMFERLLSGETPYLLTNHLPDDLSESSFIAYPVGQDGIAIIVHPDNPVTNLSTDRLRGVYLGHTGNWNALGGANEPITVLSREDGSGTRAEFERLLMGQRKTTQSAQLAPSSTAMVESVASTTGAIGYVSMSYLDERVRAITINDVSPTLDEVSSNIYPLRATIYVVGLAEPNDEYRAFISWIQSPDGQAIVAARYAPLPTP